jgi:hypothetical protein
MKPLLETIPAQPGDRDIITEIIDKTENTMPSNYPPGCKDSDLPGNGPNDIDQEELFEIYSDAVADFMDSEIPPDGWDKWIEDEMWKCFDADRKAFDAALDLLDRYEEEVWQMIKHKPYRTKGISDKAYIAVLTKTEAK